MSEETIKLLTISAIYLILFLGEYYFPYFKNRREHTQHSIRNIALATINYIVSLIFFIVALKYVFDWTQQHQLGLLNYLEVPSIYSILIAFILIDLWQYIWHRLNHEFSFLWNFHQVHHSDKDMDASTGIRFHTIEILLSHCTRLFIIPIIGIQLDQLLLYEVILLPVILFHHSNININETLDKSLRTLIVTPHIHRLHHSDIQNETDSNYASLFSFWDRLFRSYTMRNIEQNFRLGLGDKFTNQQWNRLAGVLRIPFKKMAD